MNDTRTLNNKLQTDSSEATEREELANDMIS